MNYRQWKKKYKKIHGCNPTADIDKRKQIKKVKELLCRRYGCNLNDGINNLVKAFNNAMADLFENLSDACRRISKNLSSNMEE